ncbi:hypothetical protein CR513_60089, partial [Mucuna pruriens]
SRKVTANSEEETKVDSKSCPINSAFRPPKILIFSIANPTVSFTYHAATSSLLQLQVANCKSTRRRTWQFVNVLPRITLCIYSLNDVREILELLDIKNFEKKLNGVGTPIKCSYGVSENPEFTVGLGVPLSKLKMEVLRDGMSTLLLTGLGGSGKTTLATKL